jgi:hypothetical protein
MRFLLGVLRFLRDYPQHQCRLCHRLRLDIAQLVRYYAAQCLIRRQGPWNHDGGIIMDRAKLAQMSVDDLWTLHLEISDALLLLEERLYQVRAPRVRARPVPSVLRKIPQS